MTTLDHDDLAFLYGLQARNNSPRFADAVFQLALGMTEEAQRRTSSWQLAQAVHANAAERFAVLYLDLANNPETLGPNVSLRNRMCAYGIQIMSCAVAAGEALKNSESHSPKILAFSALQWAYAHTYLHDCSGKAIDIGVHGPTLKAVEDGFSNVAALMTRKPLAVIREVELSMAGPEISSPTLTRLRALARESHLRHGKAF